MSYKQFLLTLLLLWGGLAQVQTVQPFNARYQANAPGNILLIGNTLSTCQSCDPNSASSNNGNIQSVFVDIDSDPSTTNSSEATLSLPTGSTVLFAALYWGSRTNSALPSSTTTVKLQPPGAAAYTTLTSDALYKTTLSVFPVSTPVYAAFKNVTAQVQAAGSGTYRVGGIAMDAANDGLGGYGGWSLVVAYRNNAEPFRNLSVFDGLTIINGSNPQSVTISGFLTPATGTVNARIGSVAYEGDAPLIQDSLIFASGSATTTLSDTENPSTNFFNSSISSLVTSKNPDYLNQLRIDIDRINAPAGTVPTSATVTFTTSGDVYFPQVLTTAIDIFVPNLTADFVKTASDLNGGQLLPGDVLEYTVSFSNTGQDGAINTVVRDPLPAGTTYVPGSLQVLTGANAGGKTDASGDDQAEFDSANNRVVFRLGSGANATSGGAFAPGQGSSFRFRVTVNNNTYGKVISNTATINYNAQTLGTAFSDTAGAAVNTAVASIADLSVTKSGPPNAILGSLVNYLLTVSNAGPSNVSGATLTDNVPGNLTGVTWTCAPASACSPASDPASQPTLVVQALDKEGNPASDRYMSLALSPAEPTLPDADPREAGYQAALVDGVAFVPLTGLERLTEIKAEARITNENGTITSARGFKVSEFGVPDLEPDQFSVGAPYRPWILSGASGLELRFDNTGFGLSGSGQVFGRGRVGENFLLTFALTQGFRLKGGEFAFDADNLLPPARPFERFPVLGDSSRLGADADSSDCCYLKLETGDDYLLYGQMSPDFRGLLTHYNQGFNGLQTLVRSDNFRLTAFAAAVPDANRVIPELPSDGTDFYKLPLDPGETIRPGSEQIVVFAENPAGLRKLERELKPGTDYTLDYEFGILRLLTPVPIFTPNGDRLFLRIEYAVEGGLNPPNPITLGNLGEFLRYGVQAEAGIGPFSLSATVLRYSPARQPLYGVGAGFNPGRSRSRRNWPTPPAWVATRASRQGPRKPATPPSGCSSACATRPWGRTTKTPATW